MSENPTELTDHQVENWVMGLYRTLTRWDVMTTIGVADAVVFFNGISAMCSTPTCKVTVETVMNAVLTNPQVEAGAAIGVGLLGLTLLKIRDGLRNKT